MTRLRVEQLTCTIGQRTIVKDVSFEVNPGTMTAIVGVNGVGKSTLMRVLAGIRPPACGKVVVQGRDLSTLSLRERARVVAFVAQEEAVPEDLTLEEMITLGRLPHLMPWQVGGQREREIVADCLALVGLSELAQRRAAHLSGGERRRGMLAKGLAQGTDLLLLDEPTNHLDVHHQIHLLQTMRASKRTIVASLHDLDLAMAWFDQVVVLSNGATLASGAPQQTLSPANLRTAFHVAARHIPPPPGGIAHLVIDGLTEEES